MEDEEIKAFQLELGTFGKRNTQRFRIMDDLTLSCDLCKTPEARQSITEMTRRYFDELMREQNMLNKRLDKIRRDALKAGKDDKKSAKAMDMAAKKAIDRFTSVHLGKNKRLKLKFNGFKKPPYLVFELKF